LSCYDTNFTPPHLVQKQQAALYKVDNTDSSRPSRDTKHSIPDHVPNNEPNNRRDNDGTGHSGRDKLATGFSLDQDGVELTVGGAPSVCGFELRVLVDESGTGAIEKRGVVEGFGELGKRGARFEDDDAGVVLGFWVGVDSKLGWMVRALWVGRERLVVG
jgi:hypothetical protein